MDASNFFEKLIRLTFNVDTIKYRGTIPAKSRWYSHVDIGYNADNFKNYQVYAYSIIKGFVKLNVVHSEDYYEGEEGFYPPFTIETPAKYDNLAEALINQAPEAIFIIVTKLRYLGNDNYLSCGAVYEVPNLKK